MRCRGEVSKERCITACTGDEKEFHGKACPYSPNGWRHGVPTHMYFKGVFTDGGGANV